jgi:hypothetical protein
LGYNSFVSSVGFGTLTTSTRKTALLSLVHRFGMRARLFSSSVSKEGIGYPDPGGE